MKNAFLKLPDSPGKWVNLEGCVCGAKYKACSFQVTFPEGAALVRMSNQDSNGGFRSRGPVLWAMRVIKASRWYELHMDCGE